MSRQALDARADLRAPDPAQMARGRRTATKVARRVRRSRALAWSVRGLGITPAVSPSVSANPGSVDVWDRVRRWCDVIVDAGAPHSPTHGGDLSSQALDANMSLETLRRVLEGAELAAARLVVASFVPESLTSLQARAHVHG